MYRVTLVFDDEHMCDWEQWIKEKCIPLEGYNVKVQSANVEEVVMHSSGILLDDLPF